MEEIRKNREEFKKQHEEYMRSHEEFMREFKEIIAKEEKERAIQMELPIFSGKDPQEWLGRIESYFRVHRTPSQNKFSLIKRCMKGRAEYWFGFLLDFNPRLTWSKFKEDFMGRFEGLEIQGEDSTINTHANFSNVSGFNSPIDCCAQPVDAFVNEGSSTMEKIVDTVVKVREDERTQREELESLTPQFSLKSEVQIESDEEIKDWMRIPTFVPVETDFNIGGESFILGPSMSPQPQQGVFPLQQTTESHLLGTTDGRDADVVLKIATHVDRIYLSKNHTLIESSPSKKSLQDFNAQNAQKIKINRIWVNLLPKSQELKNLDGENNKKLDLKTSVAERGIGVRKKACVHQLEYKWLKSRQLELDMQLVEVGKLHTNILMRKTTNFLGLHSLLYLKSFERKFIKEAQTEFLLLFQRAYGSNFCCYFSSMLKCLNQKFVEANFGGGNRGSMAYSIECEVMWLGWMQKFELGIYDVDDSAVKASGSKENLEVLDSFQWLIPWKKLDWLLRLMHFLSSVKNGLFSCSLGDKTF